MDKKSEEFYKRLKEELTDTAIWPSEYLYKFIVPTSDEKIKQVEDAFNNMGAVIETKKSKNGNYTSVSINVKMKNPQAVVDKYIELSQVEGIISL
ncbi:DUF493 domain-containing protein [Flavobacterium suaedae]|uniref:DUF493 domain-containing protein n=1 Tax=Flavobacterium suaedae TaxID=1767027 RepID=A0ABQ1JRN8_9FLAO|nr:DUF493 family protein [Flavobacterium suaedae]GGB74672.1 DUF493 domain-containing protein [Flavobacterium suaedae]